MKPKQQEKVEGTAVSFIESREEKGGARDILWYVKGFL